MPKIQSSSRSDMRLVLFSDEQRSIAKVAKLCDWLMDNITDPEDYGGVVAEAEAAGMHLKNLLSMLINAKPTEKQPTKA